MHRYWWSFLVLMKSHLDPTTPAVEYPLLITLEISNLVLEIMKVDMVDDIMEAVFNDPADTLWRQVFNSIKFRHQS